MSAVIWAATLTSKGAAGPRTKKNHGRIITVKGISRLLPSEQYEAWEGALRFTPELPALHLARWTTYRRMSNKEKARHREVAGDMPALLPARPMNCRALIWLDREWAGDAVGYYQAVADALQAWGVIPNDRHIRSWDGSRVRVDHLHPRVDVTLTEYVE